MVVTITICEEDTRITDRFTRGFAAGAFGGVLVDLLSLLTYNLLRITNWRFLDFAGLLIFGRKPTGAAEIIISVLGHLSFSAAMGVLFAYLLPFTSRRLFLLKGWFFGVLIWFSIYSVVHLFQLPQLRELDLGTVVSNMVKASLYGLALAWALARLGMKSKL
jgi:hypothetical protein